MDVFNFCENTDADVFFMFRPFSGEFLSRILKKLEARAASRKTVLTVIYSERMLVAASHTNVFARNQAFRKALEARILGQDFYVSHQCGLPELVATSRVGYR